MRQLFVICTILIQFLAYIPAEAGTTMPAMKGTQKESPLIFSSFFEHEHPADLTSQNHVTGIAFKLRTHRPVPAMAGWHDEVLPVPVPSCKQAVVYAAPVFLPLVRFLLYPKHYFW